MRRALIAGAALLALVLAALWLAGAFDALAAWALEAQRAAQNRMAGVLRALRGGQPGALAGLIGLAFLYGLLHAVGPGHGKVLIGGYAVARPVSALRVLAIAFLSSMAQAGVAVALVLAAALALGWSRERLVALADGPLMQAGTAAVLLIGLWLVLRGLRDLIAGGHHHHHHHDDRHHHPDPAEIARATGVREAAALIAGIAIRPCSGALVVMALTLAMGIPLAGVAATFAMGLGTFLTVTIVGLGAGLMRSGALASLSGSPMLRLALPLLELGAGLTVALAAATVLFRGF